MTAPILLADLTLASVQGTGVFDILMRATKEHLEQEFKQNRIKGTEYATVYLGSLNTVMGQSVQFLLSKDKAAFEAALVESQVRLAEAQILMAEAQRRLVEAQILKETNDRELTTAQTAKVVRETLLINTQELQLVAQTALVTRQALNAVIEGEVLTAQKCKLQAEFDLTVANTVRTGTETSLMTQKVLTERAQVTTLGVDADSVIGRQKALFAAQSAGYARDAEQKVAKIMLDTWSVRATTNDLTTANDTNKLTDASLGSAVIKMLNGVGL